MLSSNIKLPILKKGGVCNSKWKLQERISTGKDGVIQILPPVTAAEIQAVEKERKANNILLMAIPKEHMRRFHGMDGLQNNLGKPSEIVRRVRKRDLTYFTSYSLQLKACGVEVSTENANHKFIRSLPPAWTNLAMTMRSKPDVDTLSIDNLYNNLRVFEGLADQGDDGIVNWGEHTEDEETNHALMAISSSSEGTEEDSVGKPLYSRFIKANDFKGVPHPLSGDYTPKPQEEIDESLYVYGKKGPQEPEPNVSDDRSSEYSTCQSNDSAGSIGTSSEHTVDLESEISRVPSEVYVSTPMKTTEKGVSAPKSKEVEPSCVSHIKTPRQPIKDQATPKVNRKNWNAMMERELGEGYSFTKKKCFVCGSLSHLIKDCDYYEKKMAKEAEVKKQRVCNTGNMMAKPVWTNTNRINHANQFVPRPVQLNTGRPNINSVRTNINTGRTNINSVRPRVNTVDTMESGDLLLRPQQVIIGGTLNQTPIVTDHPLKKMVDRGIFDSGCSGHMTDTIRSLDITICTAPAKGFACLIAKATLLNYNVAQKLGILLASRVQNSGILQNFIRQIENQLSHRVKIIRSDNGTEFKNRDMLEFCGNKGIKQEYSTARTPQQNGVIE
ncbi:ribonuclease H-like domain-containing protein [Tanacetum coccineum]